MLYRIVTGIALASALAFGIISIAEGITRTRHGTSPAMAGSARIAAGRFGFGGWRGQMTSVALR
jgi:hypothetical protein